jgi:peroxiredoxin
MRRSPEDLEKEAEGVFQRSLTEFGNIKAYSDQTVEEIARGRLFRLHELLVGKKAPALEGEDLQQNRVKLSDYRGKVTVVVFWAGWWPPSTAVAARGHEFLRLYEGKPFALLGVNGDDSLQAAERAVEQEKLTWPSIYDGNGGRGPLATAWGITNWPTIFVFDAEGVIRHIAHDGDRLEEVIDGLMKTKK